MNDGKVQALGISSMTVVALHSGLEVNVFGQSFFGNVASQLVPFPHPSHAVTKDARVDLRPERLRSNISGDAHKGRKNDDSRECFHSAFPTISGSVIVGLPVFSVVVSQMLANGQEAVCRNGGSTL